MIVNIKEVVEVSQADEPLGKSGFQVFGPRFYYATRATFLHARHVVTPEHGTTGTRFKGSQKSLVEVFTRHDPKADI